MWRIYPNKEWLDTLENFEGMTIRTSTKSKPFNCKSNKYFNGGGARIIVQLQGKLFFRNIL